MTDALMAHFASSLDPFLAGKREELMFERTPPWEIVMWLNSWLSSSSCLIDSWRCLGVILCFSPAESPASSRISDVMYSNTAAMNTAAVPPTLSVPLAYLNRRCILPTGNFSPALLDLVCYIALFFVRDLLADAAISINQCNNLKL